MIIEVDDTTIVSAAEIHSESWRSSHSGFCGEDLLALYTAEHQLKYLQKERHAVLLYMHTSGFSIKDDDNRKCMMI